MGSFQSFGRFVARCVVTAISVTFAVAGVALMVLGVIPYCIGKFFDNGPVKYTGRPENAKNYRFDEYGKRVSETSGARINSLGSSALKIPFGLGDVLIGAASRLTLILNTNAGNSAQEPPSTYPLILKQIQDWKKSFLGITTEYPNSRPAQGAFLIPGS